MTLTIDINPRDFEYWSGAADRAASLTDDDWDIVEPLLEELAASASDGWTDSTLNDFLWFEFDTIAQWLGYNDEADMDRKRDLNYIDDEDLVEYCDEWFHNLIDSLKARGDEESYNILGSIAYECFDYYSEVEDNPDYGEDNYDCLHEIHDNQVIFDAIFEDDRGHSAACDIIPTLEDFRDLIMTQNKENNERKK